MRGLVEGVVAGGFDLFMAPLERWKLHRIRRALIPCASGEVLELGAGTGVNLRYYDRDTIGSLTLSDRDERRRVLTERVGRLSSPLRERTRVDRVDAERLPFDDNSFDTVVATLLFCSVDCPPCGFDEIVRVLKPEGRYLFLEHVAPVRPGTARVFDWVNPVWNTVSRGCNLNRDTIGEMERSGFTFEGIHRDGDDGVFVWGVAYPPRGGGDR